MPTKQCVKRDVLKVIGARIRITREEAGFTQEGFAQEAGLDRAFYGRVERGKQNLAMMTLFTIAKRLEVDPAFLIGDVSLEDLQGT
jgi:transcriptional regulator with XRE-family HTH domain